MTANLGTPMARRALACACITALLCLLGGSRFSIGGWASSSWAPSGLSLQNNVNKVALVLVGAGIVMRVATFQAVTAAANCLLSPATGGAWAPNSAGLWLYSPAKFATMPTWHPPGCGKYTEVLEPGTNFVWQPGAACAVAASPWSADAAARALHAVGGAFLLGDSLTQQHFFSLASALEAKPTMKLNPSHHGANYATLPCGTQLYFVRNDHLRTDTAEYSFNEPEKVWLEPWVDALGTSSKLVVLNTGAHYMPDTELLLRLRETLTFLRTRRPDAIVVYRASVPGHPGCAAYTGPVASPPPLPLPGGQWHWGDLPRQNMLVSVLIRDEFPGVVFLDVEAATWLRGDRHAEPNRDCLHYCQPGVVDVWTVGLVWALRLLLDGNESSQFDWAFAQGSRRGINVSLHAFADARDHAIVIDMHPTK